MTRRRVSDVGLVGDFDGASRAGAATPTARCGVRRTTPGIGIHESRAPPEGAPRSDLLGFGEPGDCSRRQPVTGAHERHLLSATFAPSVEVVAHVLNPRPDA